MTEHEVVEPGSGRVEALRRQVEALTLRVRQLERQVAATVPVLEALRRARMWDFSAYDVCPDPSWVALDRDSALDLLRGLAGTDHWQPWSTTLERRGPR